MQLRTAPETTTVRKPSGCSDDLLAVVDSEVIKSDSERPRGCLCLRQLYILLWKNVYLKRLRRHYITTVLEIVLMVALLLGIQDEAVVREPLKHHGVTVFSAFSPTAFWDTDTDVVRIRMVYFLPDHKYVRWLTRTAMAPLGVNNVIALSDQKQLDEVMTSSNQTPVDSAVLVFKGIGPDNAEPTSITVSFVSSRLPLDVKLTYQERLITEPEEPINESQFPEMNTVLPIMAMLQQKHLERQAQRFNYTGPLPEVTMCRFPYPPYFEFHDMKTYALVLTRFCVGMLVPFAVYVARLTIEKASGMKEYLRMAGLNDWIYWISHYLSGGFMHLIIVTLMMLFLCIKHNDQGRAFIQYSDPLLLFWILMCFCSSCLMHATLLSMFFESRKYASLFGTRRAQVLPMACMLSA
ncbi:hypothetical protein HPB49_003689 [Dermacentor silvarum]|uniref:Uncharacterized protein n=1 Tax=Dermacentor silvarum TaxID=543639 RepID=A0ACB8DU09_DERSI|nr:hypothetical protein HPB49_003689 [Dermacentor silvarum]